MKTLLCALVVIVLLPFTSLAAVNTWIPSNSKILGWDEVLTLSNGYPIPVDSSIYYKVYYKLESATTQVEVTATTNNQYMVTVPAEGRYLLGVKAIRINISTGAIIGESTISWSDDPLVCLDGNTFGLSNYPLPSGPKGLK